MDERANVLDGNFEVLRIDTENSMLTFIPTPLLRRKIPAPRSHLAGGKSNGAALFALLKLHVRSFKLGGSFGDPTL